MSHTAFAPGKLILMGEHAVVYGHPALAIAVDKGMTVTLRERNGPTGLDSPGIDDVRLTHALNTVLPTAGWGVHIDSTLPIGRGMGSSAALAVALARATLAAEGRPATSDAVDELALKVEKVFHGNPSGVDQAVCARGGAIRFQRGPSGPSFEPVALPDLPIVVIDSGTAGNTAELVAGVAARQPSVDPYLTKMGELLDATWPALLAGDLPTIGQAWHENHWLLRAIGVSTPTLDQIVRLAVEAGALGAKLAGAGGGGVVIALAPDPQPVISSAERAGFAATTVRQYR
jgi:mevalonate kinase